MGGSSQLPVRRSVADVARPAEARDRAERTLADLDVSSKYVPDNGRSRDTLRAARQQIQRQMHCPHADDELMPCVRSFAWCSL